jgi:hypothetical protein
MRRVLAVLAVGASVVLGGVALASPASAAPPDKANGQHDCRVLAVCNPGVHNGWDNHRNVGG